MGLVRSKKNYMERRNILVIIWENNLRDHGVGPIPPIPYPSDSQKQNLTNMPRSTRKKSKTGICHVMLRVNTEPSTVHWGFR